MINDVKFYSEKKLDMRIIRIFNLLRGGSSNNEYPTYATIV